MAWSAVLFILLSTLFQKRFCLNLDTQSKDPVAVAILSTKIGATKLAVSWDVEEKNRPCLQAYEIYFTGPLQRSERLNISYQKAAEIKTTFFNNLDPCGQYIFSIRAISNDGTIGPSTEVNFETFQSKPSSVNDISVVYEAQALNISWTVPTFGELCIVEYRLNGWIDEKSPSQKFDKKTNSTGLYINELFACQTYSIQIIAVTSNTDGEAVIIEVETRAEIAMASNIQALAQYPNALELSAVDSNIDNKCETIIARFACEESKPGNATYKFAKHYVEGQVKGVTFKALLGPLSTFTYYRCGVALFNVAGWSPAEETILMTLPNNPTSPKNVVLKSRTNASLQFEWSLPTYTNGNIKLYSLYFQYVGPTYFVPLSCPVLSASALPRETTSLQHTFQGLIPYTSYSVQVAAQNEYGVGYYGEPLVVETGPWISDPPEELYAMTFGPYPIENIYRAHVIITWKIPCKTNGDILTFLLNFKGQRAEEINHSFSRFVFPLYDSNGLVTYNETHLKADYDYMVELAIIVKNINSSSTCRTVHFRSPAAIPQKLNDLEVQEIQIDSFVTNNPTKTAEVCNPVPELRFDSLNTINTWPPTMSWNEVHSHSNNRNNCIFEYQTTEIRWNPLQRRVINGSYVIYTIGSENCKENTKTMSSDFMDCKTNKTYCNGPLKSATDYYVVVRFFSRSGYSDVALLEFTTDSHFSLALIISSICSSLLLALAGGIFYMWITKKYNSECYA
ncbi:receptor-type tyrosine-protein phosphatase F [Eurosta solidaginis]|uniref:receptor-type tyrosine-protein phosphatase F n=1 Tax=Eurosta solidaginis TaxID=178769 RepID=UPI00353140BE